MSIRYPNRIHLQEQVTQDKFIDSIVDEAIQNSRKDFGMSVLEEVGDRVRELLYDYDYDPEEEIIITHKYYQDHISEAADSLVDIYNKDLLDWIGNAFANAMYVEEAVNEGLVDTNNFDFFRAIMAGQYKQYEDSFYAIFHELEDLGYVKLS